jgi:hypothetical protein
MREGAIRNFLDIANPAGEVMERGRVYPHEHVSDPVN